jgi:glycosyltransferase involved in cell wall biosynthesis
MTKNFQFLLVIPAYREQFRLPPYLRELVRVLSQARFSTAILVVDDGSPDEEQSALRQLIQAGKTANCEVLPPLSLAANGGKGGAILAGWRSGVQASWLAFVDADGAVPAEEVLRLFELAEQKGKAGSFPCLWASRLKAARRRKTRHLLGRLFALLVKIFLVKGIHDSQCGFKIVPATWFQRVDQQLQEHGYCFDLELLLALKKEQAQLIEVPIAWQDREGGNIKIWKDGFAMLRQLRKLKKRFNPPPL